VRRLLELVFAEGYRAPRAVRRLWALAMALRPELLCHPTCASVAEVFGETRAAVSARVRRVFNVPIKGAGGVAQAAFQKRAEVVEKYRAAQKGNQNRRRNA
jgi:hypothetical protein